MATQNAIDGELYPDNNSHTTAHPMRWRLNPTTGVNEQVPITGLTDLVAYIAASDLATSEAGAINAALVVPMVEVLATGAYEATFAGSDKRTWLGGLADPTTVYVHWQSASAGYHEVAPVIYRAKRPAATS